MPLHRNIYDSIIAYVEKGMVANPITLKSYFKDSAQSNVFEYMVNISASASTVMNVDTFAKEVYDCFVRRQLISVGNEIVEGAQTNAIDNTVQNQIEAAEQHLFNLAADGTTESGFVSLRESVLEMLSKIRLDKEKKSAVTGIPTSFLELDNMLGGMQPSDLIILAGRPSMGKTAFAVNIALYAAKNFFESYKKANASGKPSAVGFFSLEMSAEQISNRMLAIDTGIESNKIRMASVTNSEEFRLISEKCNDLSKLPLFIDDTPALSISAIRTRARRLKRQANVGLIVVDYLQLIRGSSKYSDNRVQEIGEITQGLKAIAKELDLPVIALSQLSRSVETREDKRPQLSDLRDSGNIEQDADVVMFIYREEYYLARKKPMGDDIQKFNDWQNKMNKVQNIAEIIIAKQRNGPIGNCCLFYHLSTISFKNLVKSEHDHA